MLDSDRPVSDCERSTSDLSVLSANFLFINTKKLPRTVAADFHTWETVLLGFLNKLLCFLV